mmetsp:Transcript_43926/g.137916  ORF Transcript_43926/g.137916 Transcript_43926/m.137916 type:complete len:211 (-) Transcript_43926:481-1113(-)
MMKIRPAVIGNSNLAPNWELIRFHLVKCTIPEGSVFRSTGSCLPTSFPSTQAAGVPPRLALSTRLCCARELMSRMAAKSSPCWRSAKPYMGLTGGGFLCLLAINAVRMRMNSERRLATSPGSLSNSWRIADWPCFGSGTISTPSNRSPPRLRTILLDSVAVVIRGFARRNATTTTQESTTARQMRLTISTTMMSLFAVSSMEVSCDTMGL